MKGRITGYDDCHIYYRISEQFEPFVGWRLEAPKAKWLLYMSFSQEHTLPHREMWIVLCFRP
jgi:hypothetical protein